MKALSVKALSIATLFSWCSFTTAAECLPGSCVEGNDETSLLQLSQTIQHGGEPDTTWRDSEVDGIARAALPHGNPVQGSRPDGLSDGMDSAQVEKAEVLREKTNKTVVAAEAKARKARMRLMKARAKAKFGAKLSSHAVAAAKQAFTDAASTYSAEMKRSGAKSDLSAQYARNLVDAAVVLGNKVGLKNMAKAKVESKSKSKSKLPPLSLSSPWVACLGWGLMRKYVLMLGCIDMALRSQPDAPPPVEAAYAAAAAQAKKIADTEKKEKAETKKKIAAIKSR